MLWPRVDRVAASAQQDPALARRWVDLAVVGGFLVGALWVTSGLWLHPDQTLVWWSDHLWSEWYLEHAAYSLVHLDNPLFSSRINAPDGVNVMANTSMLGLGIPLAPVTLLFGPQTTFVLILVVSFAGTATGWYLLLSRTLHTSRTAAAVCGGFTGFAPGLLSQSAHLQFTAQFLVPALVWAVLRLATAAAQGLPRRGVVLGLLVTWQAFIGEETLLLAALGLGVVLLVMAVTDLGAARQRLRPFSQGLGVTAATAAVLLAYPLWFQFFGPGHWGPLFIGADYSLDVLSYFAVSEYSVAGPGTVSSLAPNMTEEASFFGPLLLPLCALVVLRLWRRPLVKGLAAGIAVFGLLSLGPAIRVAGRETGLPGPQRLVAHLPIFEDVIIARFALVVIPMLGILLALAVDEARRAASGAGSARWRWALLGTIAVALAPLAPVPYRTAEPVASVPAFLTNGEWRAYVPPGRSLVPVPPSSLGSVPTGLWSLRTHLEVVMTGGPFTGPAGPEAPYGIIGPPRRPTTELLANVEATGAIPAITPAVRSAALDDLRFWRAAIVVLGETSHRNELRQTLDALLGPGTLRSGAWVWDVRPLVGDAAQPPTVAGSGR